MNQVSIADAIFAVQEEFEVLIAENLALVHESYQLRYQVYCVERGFLSGAEGLEFDAFDSHSRHVVLVSRDSGRVVGTVRVVLSRPDEPSKSFPLQLVCDTPLWPDLPIRSTVEISRFAISKERRSGLSASLMRLGLVQGLVRLSRDLGISHWTAVMEPTLLRLLQRNSIYFNNLGPLVDYHGTRQPCFNKVADLLDRVYDEQPEIWEYLTESAPSCASAMQSTRSLAA